ncbi:predicted protein [Sclerotinia sclerotiorum 1980 UF-70]|uniref:Uncharacterized protein n=1 Tax=Sclerotinia sclerotiorum (strain ATCC 18683 / 1980 / Ss-1) TaxID=665079 RepID=A7ELF9_SCLS1|nr:predicted protein [Sclerotinia sclerotiorum 1980 UF-70]EDO03675.1 predicted protein [Sclerotinia sclerotiorum 1980 UF-70]
MGFPGARGPSKARKSNGDMGFMGREGGRDIERISRWEILRLGKWEDGWEVGYFVVVVVHPYTNSHFVLHTSYPSTRVHIFFDLG